MIKLSKVQKRVLDYVKSLVCETIYVVGDNYKKSFVRTLDALAKKGLLEKTETPKGHMATYKILSVNRKLKEK